MTFNTLRTIVAVSLCTVPAMAIAGHSELTVPKADTFLLGGEQRAPMTVSGRNVGKADVTILALTGGKDTPIVAVAPGKTFSHVFAPGQIAAIRNMSPSVDARLSVDFTGSPSSLSMRYALPQKD